jgi:hypothetical protein
VTLPHLEPSRVGHSSKSQLQIEDGIGYHPPGDVTPRI